MYLFFHLILKTASWRKKLSAITHLRVSQLSHLTNVGMFSFLDFVFCPGNSYSFIISYISCSTGKLLSAKGK